MCLMGMVVQTVFALALVIFAVLSKRDGFDHSALGVGVFAGLGALIWLALAIVFDQHRRERIESIEAATLAEAGGVSTSVFQTSEELRPAARRLAGLHKYFVPIVSLVVAGVLGGLGAYLIWHFRDLMKGTATGFAAPAEWVSYAGLIMGAVIAALGFVLARYTAGMAKQPAWENLRGGSAFAAGTAVLALLLAVGHGTQLWRSDIVLRYLPYVVGGFLLLIGAEVLLNFVMGAYRPRRPGEIPRAAFDSRLLSFVAAPDRIAQSISDAINYQLGFDVTGGWFYKLLSKMVAPLALAGVAIVWLLSCIAVVGPHERAMVLRFGRPVGGELGPGHHFKMPWPIDTVYVPEYFEKDSQGRDLVAGRTVTGLRMTELGTRATASNEPILWTNDHPGEEVNQYVRARAEEIAPAPAEGAARPGSEPAALRKDELVDLAIVSLELPLHYVVSDVSRFDRLAAPPQREPLLRAVAKREITRYLRSVNLDQVLGKGRREVGEALRQRVQTAFDTLNGEGAGVRVVYLGIAGAHPPKDTAKSFEIVVQADQRKQANLQAAEADKIVSLTQSVGDVRLADEIVRELDELEAVRTRGADDAQIAAQEFAVQGLIERAGGTSADTLARARAERWATHMSVRGRAARYLGQLALYEAAPTVFLTNQYFDAMRHLTTDARLIIVGDRGSTRYDVDLTDKELNSNVFGTERDDPEAR